MRRLLFLLLPLSLLAAPAQIVLIRNAETSPDSDTLSLKGRMRSIALAPYFQGTPSVLFYGLPIAIFAGPESKDTVAPLSSAINVPVSEKFRSPQALANELLTNPDYEGRMVLVCWPHEQMGELAARLGTKRAPKKWAEDSYDRLWTLTFDENERIAFNNLPQKLLFGDSEK